MTHRPVLVHEPGVKKAYFTGHKELKGQGQENNLV